MTLQSPPTQASLTSYNMETSIPYNNREIKEMFNDLKTGQDRIESQVIKTNGRVTTLEKWRYTILGGMAVSTMVVIPILGWSLYTLVNLQDKVNIATHTAVAQALSAYEVTVK